MSRRNFVQLLGATLAVGGTACYRPSQKIVPYVRRPPEVTPGNPLHFASAYALEGYGTGLLVESHAGRPTKVEGNPDHPDSLGATGVFEQALPSGCTTTTGPRACATRAAGLAWRSLLIVLAQHAERLAADGGRQAALPGRAERLAAARPTCARASCSGFPRPSSSPSRRWPPTASSRGRSWRSGARSSRGTTSAQREVILALDADFLTDGPEQVRLSRQFAAGREPGRRT